MPPSALPAVVETVDHTGSSPNPTQANSTASEEKGKTVPAKKAEMNIPIYPHSVRS